MIKNIFEEIITGNFPNLKDNDIKTQEAHRAPNKLNPNRPTPRHIIIKMAKVKERILKAAREKQSFNYKGTPIGYQLISLQKHYRPGGNGKRYLKC